MLPYWSKEPKGLSRLSAAGAGTVFFPDPPLTFFAPLGTILTSPEPQIALRGAFAITGVWFEKSGPRCGLDSAWVAPPVL